MARASLLNLFSVISLFQFDSTYLLFQSKYDGFPGPEQTCCARPSFETFVMERFETFWRANIAKKDP